MEENYLVKHSAQAPSQKVGVARILNSRRVVGAPFLAATAVVALGVAAGAVATFALVPRIGAGFVFGAARASAQPDRASPTRSRSATTACSRPTSTAVALRATVPRIAALPTPRRARRAASASTGAAPSTTATTAATGRAAAAPRCARVLGEDGRRVFVPSRACPRRRPDAAQRAALERQEIDVVGLSVPVAFALDRPVAFELSRRPRARASALQLAPRWSGEVALRLAPPGAPAVDVGADDGRDGAAHAAGARYVAYSRDALSMARAGAGPPLPEVEALRRLPGAAARRCRRA